MPKACRHLPGLRRFGLPPHLPMYPLREGEPMTLQELSRCYEEAAVPLRARLRLLRQFLYQREKKAAERLISGLGVH